MKYYVKSGQLERIVIADSPLQAAEKASDALQNGERIDMFFYVDERGFRAPANGSIDTESLPAHAIPMNQVLEDLGELNEIDEMFEDYDPDC